MNAHSLSNNDLSQVHWIESLDDGVPNAMKV